jgi:hypothetical protein
MIHFIRVALLIFLCFVFYPGHCQENRWRLFSEVSPVSRSANDRVLNNPSAFNFEWRNRLGFRLDKQTFAGATLSYRNYQLNEQSVSQLSGQSLALDYQLNNNLFGAGIFITRFLQIKPKLFLHATAFGMMELGNGKYTLTYDTPFCQDCFTPQNGPVLTQQDITSSKTSFKEQNKYVGIEVGSKFYVLPKIAFYTSLTLFQYEVFHTSTVNPEFQDGLPSDMRRPLIQSGHSFNFFTDRPIFHFGALFHLD